MAEELLPDPPLMQADETMSPVDLPGAPEDGQPLRWTSLAIALAALILLFSNAATIDDWAKELPPSAAAEQVTQVTGRWSAFTDRLGLGMPRALLHAQWKRAETAKFQ